jgi:ankyrin repeat protein
VFFFGLLLAQGADPDSKNNNGRTPLLYAAWSGHEAVVKLLLEHEVKPDSRDDRGRTPLLWAAARGYVPLVTLLGSRTSDPNVKDVFSRTPLHAAAAGGYLQSVQKLLAIRGIHPVSKDNLGHTALSEATQRGRKAVMALLRTQETSSVDDNDIETNTITYSTASSESTFYCSICLIHILDVVLRARARRETQA